MATADGVGVPDELKLENVVAPLFDFTKESRAALVRLTHGSELTTPETGPPDFDVLKMMRQRAAEIDILIAWQRARNNLVETNPQTYSQMKSMKQMLDNMQQAAAMILVGSSICQETFQKVLRKSDDGTGLRGR